MMISSASGILCCGVLVSGVSLEVEVQLCDLGLGKKLFYMYFLLLMPQICFLLMIICAGLTLGLS